MDKSPGSANSGFEVFYRPFTEKEKLSQIDVQDVGDNYSITLTFEQDLGRSVKLKVGSLEVSVEESGGLYGGSLGLKSRVMDFTETQVLSVDRSLTAKVPKAPARGFFGFGGYLTGKLYCPGLVVEIPDANDIHVAIIDTISAASGISVDKHVLVVKGAMLTLEVDKDIRFTLSVTDTSSAKESRVLLERCKGSGVLSWAPISKDYQILASSKEGHQVRKVWNPAKPCKRRVLVGHSTPFHSRRIREALEIRGLPFALGDPAPDTRYYLRLVAKRGWWSQDQVDQTAISFA